MKRFTPHLLILAVGFLALALMTSNATAQSCQHLHQLSKKLIAQNIEKKKCKLCACEKMETYVMKHRIQASILANCDCDETNDVQCDEYHAHANSGNGELEGWACVWSPTDDSNGGAIIGVDADYQSSGIPNDAIFDATITRVMKYCKDSTDNPGEAYPRAGYHNGTWKITSGGNRIARGSLYGVEGVDPSYERSYTSTARTDHNTLPCGISNSGITTEDFCEGSDCYLAGWQVGCLKGGTTDLFYRFQCPPTGTYDKDEVDNIADCAGGDLFVINDFRGKQICITPTESWKIKACYSGGVAINNTLLPCNQWGNNWCVRLEGVISIKATDCLQ
jgi:Tfp pilus assembly protein PilV